MTVLFHPALGRGSRGLVFMVAVSLAGCAATPAPPKDIASVVSARPEFSTLAKLVQQAGLTEVLKGDGPFTVFAPTDEAFKAVPAKTLESIASDPARLKAVLTYHVVPGKVTSAQVQNGAVKTVQGASLNAAKAGTFVTVDEAVVTQPDIPASNGVVHAIDRVLVPPKS